MTIYKFLKHEHREVEKLLKKANKIWDKNPKSSHKLFETIKKELISHNKAEEECFYMPLKELACSSNKYCAALEGKEEHHMIALMLKELSTLDFKSPIWQAKLSVLTEMVAHHIKEEESMIFKEGHKFFSKAEAKEICVKMKTLKSKYLKQVDPLMEKEVQLILQPSLDFNTDHVLN